MGSLRRLLVQPRRIHHDRPAMESASLSRWRRFGQLSLPARFCRRRFCRMMVADVASARGRSWNDPCSEARDKSSELRVCAAVSMLDVSSQAGSSRSGPLLSAVSISKRYGDFLANDGIDLDLFPAEIHALLGENGAGKSTLVKTMYGLIQPSGGELRWMGQKIVLAGPSEGRDLGIGMVFQHFTLFENLNVAENVALGLPPTESLGAISGRLDELCGVCGCPRG